MYNPGGRARLAVQASTITPRTPEILDELSAWLPPCFGIGSNVPHSVASAVAVHKVSVFSPSKYINMLSHYTHTRNIVRSLPLPMLTMMMMMITMAWPCCG